MDSLLQAMTERNAAVRLGLIHILEVIIVFVLIIIDGFNLIDIVFVHMVVFVTRCCGNFPLQILVKPPSWHATFSGLLLFKSHFWEMPLLTILVFLTLSIFSLVKTRLRIEFLSVQYIFVVYHMNLPLPPLGWTEFGIFGHLFRFA